MPTEAQTEAEDIKTIEIIPTNKPQHEGYVTLRQQGVNQCAAAEMVGYNKSYSPRLEKKYTKYLISGDTKLLRLAKSAVKNIVQGQPFGAIDKVKDSTALQAAQMVYDRNDPVVKINQNLNINCDISPVDLEAYRR